MPLPFVEHVGVRIVEATGGTSLLTLAVQPCHLNSHGIVHGGALFTLADTGMGAALYTTLDPSEACTTIEIKINYFRPVLQGEVVCRTSIAHRGRTTSCLESSVSVGGVEVAKATGTFAIVPRRSPGAA